MILINQVRTVIVLQFCFHHFDRALLTSVHCGHPFANYPSLTTHCLFFIAHSPLPLTHYHTSTQDDGFNSYVVQNKPASLPIGLSQNRKNQIISDYMNEVLPKLAEDTYYMPYFIGGLLSRHDVTIIDGVRISKYSIMNYLKINKYVPVGKTTLYKVTAYVSLGILPENATWTEIGAYGRKALLNPREIMFLIIQIKNETRGGEAMSSDEIKKLIEDNIFRIHSKKGTLHTLPMSIPSHTLNALLSVVKAQSVFDIYDSVSNKTESRAVAEWSLRSTLAYTMIVACNHFLPNTSCTCYHPKKKDLNKEALLLWKIVESSYNKMIGNTGIREELVPVLPNLVTTTDEVTIFATAGTVHNKESFFVVSKPEEIKNEICDSGKRNHYKKKPSGNAHCRGVRIVTNSTFTAGGLSAPIFVAIYGLTREEMPNEDIITIAVPGLVAGSSQNLYSTGNDYITFVCGIDSTKESTAVNEINISADNDNDEVMVDNDPNLQQPIATKLSKESQVASLYHKKVYYPFIRKICKDKYLYNGDDDMVPTYLTAISWMDGCASQLNLITSPENMQFEKDMSIRCCKHSAARTAVEQAADTGCMFKLMKKVISDTKNPHSSNSSVYRFLDQTLTSMESRHHSIQHPSPHVLNLSLHKKKAVLATVAKLPIATARAYTDENIKKAFALNGQLDLTHRLVPSLQNLLNTYRGNIESTCLKKKEELIESLCEEAYMNGIVIESTFDALNVPKDRNTTGDVVDRDVGIRQENRQRAKHLTNNSQIRERLKVLHEIKLSRFHKIQSLYNAEQKRYEENQACERKIVLLYTQYHNISLNEPVAASQEVFNPESTIAPSYNSICNTFIYEMMQTFQSKLSKPEMLVFVQVRSKSILRGGKMSYLEVPKRKPELFERMWTLHNEPVMTRKYPECPLEPSMM